MSILFGEFSSICLYLNKIGIVPTLMGSLGLEFISKEDWEPSDIDIHVQGDPRGWEAPDEHEFQKNGVSVEYGSIDSLYDFAGIAESDIELIQLNEIKFRVPSLKQFLQIYKASSKDSYRNDNNNNKDFKKIDWLNSHI